jgi:two-component system OmpR family sensor kinase/two-component system sensor histidine kinase BaeS
MTDDRDPPVSDDRDDRMPSDREGEHPHGHGPLWHGGPPWAGWGGGRPPWWPDDEPWPPRGPDAWRGMRRRFVGKFALFLVLVVAAIAGLSALIGQLAVRGGEHRGRFFPLGILALIVVVILVARAGRRFAAPLADVMEAADRVAAGDYDAKVRERGPGDVRRLGRAFNAMTERLGSNEARRRQLLADVTHELRTPLSVIRAHLEAIVDGLYPADHTHLGRILEETTVMSRLLDDLQTLSTAEAGALKLHRQRTDPRELVDAAVASFSARAAEDGVRLGGRTAERLPEVDVDPVRIGEVLSNLLSNAIRHTPVGGEVSVSGAAREGAVELAVRDTGPGIPAEQLPHVFDRFSRSPDSPGAGLGLAIAKSLVEAHGGRIRAESGPGGTTISFDLPAG